MYFFSVCWHGLSIYQFWNLTELNYWCLVFFICFSLMISISLNIYQIKSVFNFKLVFWSKFFQSCNFQLQVSDLYKFSKSNSCKHFDGAVWHFLWWKEFLTVFIAFNLFWRRDDEEKFNELFIFLNWKMSLQKIVIWENLVFFPNINTFFKAS